jgi:hypothetical protein
LKFIKVNMISNNPIRVAKLLFIIDLLKLGIELKMKTVPKIIIKIFLTSILGVRKRKGIIMALLNVNILLDSFSILNLQLYRSCIF